MTSIDVVLFPNQLFPGGNGEFFVFMKVHFMSPKIDLLFRPRYNVKFYASTLPVKDNSAVDVTSNVDVAYEQSDHEQIIHHMETGDVYENVRVGGKLIYSLN